MEEGGQLTTCDRLGSQRDLRRHGKDNKPVDDGIPKKADVIGGQCIAGGILARDQNRGQLVENGKRCAKSPLFMRVFC